MLKEKETVSDEFCWHLSNQDAYFSSRSGSLRSSQSHTVYTFLDATPFDFIKVMQMSYDILGEDIGRLCKMQHFNTFHAF